MKPDLDDADALVHEVLHRTGNLLHHPVKRARQIRAGRIQLPQPRALQDHDRIDAHRVGADRKDSLACLHVRTGRRAVEPRHDLEPQLKAVSADERRCVPDVLRRVPAPVQAEHLVIE